MFDNSSVINDKQDVI